MTMNETIGGVYGTNATSSDNHGATATMSFYEFPHNLTKLALGNLFFKSSILANTSGACNGCAILNLTVYDFNPANGQSTLVCASTQALVFTGTAAAYRTQNCSAYPNTVVQAGHKLQANVTLRSATAATPRSTLMHYGLSAPNLTSWISVEWEQYPYFNSSGYAAPASNASAVSEGDWILLSSFWQDDRTVDSYWIEWNATGNSSNQTPRAFSSSNDSWGNYSIQIPTGTAGKTIAIIVWANDTFASPNLRNSTSAVLVNVRANSPPQFQWASNNFTNGSEFRTPLSIGFFANWTDDNGTTRAVMTFDSTNYTMALWNGTSNQSAAFNVNLSGLPAGTYYYNFSAYDGASANQSATYSLVIAQNSTWAMNHTLNLTASDLLGTYQASVRAQCSVSGITGAPASSVELRNGTTVQTAPTIDYSESPKAAQWNFTCSNAGTANYSSKSSALFFNVSQATLNLTLQLNGTNGNAAFTYPQTVNATGWSNVSGKPLVLFENGTAIADTSNPSSTNASRAAGDYNFTLFFAGDANYSSASQTFFANISRGSVNLTLLLNGSFSDKPYVYAQAVNASSWSNVSGQAIRLLQNGTILANGTQAESSNLTLAAGDYNYTSYFQGNANYSSASVTFFANVSANGTWVLAFTLNSTAANLTGAYPAAVNAFCSANAPFNLVFSRNGTLVQSGSPVNYSEITPAQTTSWNCSGGGGNYSFQSSLLYSDIVKGDSGITLLLNGSAANSSYGQGSFVNASTWKNQSQANLTLYRNSTGVAFGFDYAEESNQSRANGETLNYTSCVPESQNYSGRCSTLFAITLADLPPQFNWVAFNFTNGSNYVTPLSIAFYLNVSDDNGTASVIMTFNNANYSMGQWNGSAANGVWNYNFSQLPAGTYYFNFTANDGAFANSSQAYSLVIFPATPSFNLTLNASQLNKSYAFNETVNASASNALAEGNLTLYRNGSSVAFGINVAEESNQTRAAAETLNYTACFPASQNYSESCAVLYATFQEAGGGNGGTGGGGGGSSGNPGFYETPTPTPTPIATATPFPSPAVTANASPQIAIPGAGSILEEIQPELFYSIENVGSLRILKQVRVVTTNVSGVLRKSSVVTITLFNSGTASLQNIVLNSDLLDGAGQFSENPELIQGSKAEWRISGLKAGENKTITYTLGRGVAKTEFDQIKTTALVGLNSGLSPTYEILLALLLGGSGVAVWYWRKHRPLSEEEKLKQALETLSEEDTLKNAQNPVSGTEAKVQAERPASEDTRKKQVSKSK